MNKQIQQYAASILSMINVKKNELIWVTGPVVAKELLLELQRQVIAAGAFPDMDVFFDESSFIRLHDSSPEQLEKFPVVEKARVDNCDKHVTIWSLDEYVVDYTKIPAKNLEINRRVRNKNTRRLDTVFGVGAEFPTVFRAKKSGMEYQDYLDFFYGAVNVDLDKLYDSYRWLENALKDSKKLRIKGKDTDLTMDVGGRKWISDESFFYNLPDGELFTGPVEDSVEGYINFKDRQVYRDSVPVDGLFMKFEKGKIVDFDAKQGKQFFEETINTDKGSRYVGELGIGINPKVDRITNFDLFDEKILGTIHIAIGDSFVETGSKNKSGIHWDLIKDLRDNGVILADDRVLFEKGNWIKQ